jgi:membrane protein YdbS with pleckstrin-like domain
MRTTFVNPSRVTVEGPGGGGFPWEAVVLVLVLAAVAGVAHAVAPYVHLLWEVLAMCATLAGCAVLALAGSRFARWQARRGQAEPEALRYRSGERIREPRR